ncbi:PREDICTED: plant UBX domain-containing protein 13-like isoform X2 [Camelina sativa]|uniref:Plant UBX domain-containing protein 13-like isoform X2 n=1 Tax=Camelina sativa TaxID=90675 RepID=A0ABM0U084_CAMSA|nr:PREDICTED: plant UBX domain-containing protein 13-like isoform X2 [Camelina sativa]
MATPTQEAIDTFMSITGASNAVAVRKLEEYRGNLNRAVNAYYNHGHQNSLYENPANIPQGDAMDIDGDVTPALSEARTTVPFPRRDPPMPPHPRGVRQIPIEVKDSSVPSGRSNDAPSIEDVTQTSRAHSPAPQEAVILDDDSQSASTGQSRRAIPVGSAQNSLQGYSDIEEELIRAAIEASKMETGVPRNQSPENEQSRMEDDDNAAKPVTVQSAEEEVLRSEGWKASSSEREASEVFSIPGQQGTRASNGRLAAPSSLSEDDDDDDDDDYDDDGDDDDDDDDYDPDYVDEELIEPRVRHRPRRAVSGSRAPLNDDLPQDAIIHSPDAGNGFPSEWGGISSEEHDEAVMLEAAMFGSIPNSEYRVPYAPSYPRRTQRPPSPSLTAQRLIREQQDDAYLASLEADRVKAEARRLAEEAARVEALEEAKRKEEEACRKVEEEQELERQLVTKEASLPQEPPAGEENAITLQVRLPDGTRHGRRFLKSDKLQSLFDFMDICRVVKPNTYRLVRPFPRHAFGDGECSSTLNDVGLTSKQEALFLELI